MRSIIRIILEKCIAGLQNDTQIGNVGGRCKILPFNDTLWANTNAILNYSRFGIGGSAFRVGVKPEFCRFSTFWGISTYCFREGWRYA